MRPRALRILIANGALKGIIDAARANAKTNNSNGLAVFDLRGKVGPDARHG
jgi:hypothetical protein